MITWRWLSRRVRALLRRDRLERELDDEMRLHLELEVEDLMRTRGLPAAEARRLALIAFGGVEKFKEAHRDARGVRWLEDGWQDIRYAARTLRRAPVFAAVALLTLGLGIGMNAAVFSVVKAVLLQPLPYREPAGVVSVWTRYLPESGHDFDRASLSVPEYLEYRSAARAVEEVAAYTPGAVNLAASEAVPERVRTIAASANLFALLGVEAALGRTFRSGDDAAGAPCVVVLSDGLWRERFGGSPAAVGRQVRLDGEACEVVGVMPAGFFFPDQEHRLWRPLSVEAVPELASDRDSHWLMAVARLREGLEEARAELEPMMAGWRREYEHHRGHFLVLRPLREDLVGEQRPAILVVFGAVGLVLLIICANLASLLLARAEGRRREIAVRFALGAARGRVLRQLLTESTMLTALGGAAALPVAVALLRLLKAHGPEGIPRLDQVSVDPGVLLFTGAVSVATGILLGLLPGLQIHPLRLQDSFRGEDRSARPGSRAVRLRQLLVVSEVALTMAVVVAASLLARSYRELRRVDLGFDPGGVVALNVTLPTRDYPDPAGVASFHTSLAEQVAALPGVRAAGLVSDLPLRSTPGMDSFRIDGRPEPGPGEPAYNGGFLMASAGLFEALGIPVLRGRGIGHTDVRGRPFVAVIDELAAERYWPGQDPIGQRIRYYGVDSVWLTVVGVVGAVRHSGPREPARPAVYVPLAQMPRAGSYTGHAMTLAVRTAERPEALIGPIRGVVRRLDPAVPVSLVATLGEVVARANGQPRLATGLVGLFALAALLLGSLGVYGVLAYSVQARTREIGIRMALGADPARLRRMVLGQGIGVAGLGIVLGGVLYLALSRLVSSLLFGVPARDPLTLLGAAALLAALSMAASYLPARSATRVDPGRALRAG